MRGPRSAERGFTLVEVLFATGIWVVLAGACLYATQSLFAGARQIVYQRSQYVALTRLSETWDAESSTALAIFVPARDVLSLDNADGHELDFYSRDAAHYGHFWAYRWDRDSLTLQRYTYPSPATTAVSSDPPIPNVTLFRAVRKPASTIALPLLGGYVPKDIIVNFGYPGVDGGNALVDVTVANAHQSFEIELLAGTMASGFGVVVATFTPTPSATAAPPPPTAAPPPNNAPPPNPPAPNDTAPPPPSTPQPLPPPAGPTAAPPTDTPVTPSPATAPPPSAPINITVQVVDPCQTGAVAAYDLYVGTMSAGDIAAAYGIGGLDPSVTYAVTEHHTSPSATGGNGTNCF